MNAFLARREPPPAAESRAYLLEGALFDERPSITIHDGPDGSFQRMEVRYHRDKIPMVLQRSSDDDAEAARGEVIEFATMCGRRDIAEAVESAEVVIEWNVDRTELDEDAWFALHLWQAWVLGRSQGWLYAPGEGIFDAQLKRRCGERTDHGA
ncbi:MAG: hypothetical protein ABI467_22825 [Kofleriaceae bacterium]